MFKKFLIVVVIFVVLGVPVASAILSIFDQGSNYLAIAGGGLVLALMLAFRSAMLLFLVMVLAIGINLPEDLLLDYRLDKIVLLGVLLCIIIFPSLHKVMTE